MIRLPCNHPRVCGEHRPPEPDEDDSWGSSPRMRGTPYKSGLKKLSPGIIPAYAGNTPLLVVTPTEPWDHPRVCGEHDRCRRDKCVQRGSSPRMRGTRFGRAGRYARHGIIPAYAGNTQHASPRLTYPGDHPRVCGEHMGMASPASVPKGSSPRMRGTRYVSGDRTAATRDHPRVCGEHLQMTNVLNDEAGSSPRMRGTPTDDKRVER